MRKGLGVVSREGAPWSVVAKFEWWQGGWGEGAGLVVGGWRRLGGCLVWSEGDIVEGGV